jgi:hypothetical protein
MVSETQAKYLISHTKDEDWKIVLALLIDIWQHLKNPKVILEGKYLMHYL